MNVLATNQQLWVGLVELPPLLWKPDRILSEIGRACSQTGEIDDGGWVGFSLIARWMFGGRCSNRWKEGIEDLPCYASL